MDDRSNPQRHRNTVRVRRVTTRVVVTGAAGAVGSRVVRLLAGRPDEIDVLALDRVSIPAIPGADAKLIDLASGDLGAAFAGADSVVHLATVATPGEIDPSADTLELAIVQRVLDGAAEAGVSQVVFLSSAMVYGAWVGNPVPLTEDSAIRPNPDCGYAQVRAAVERSAQEWGHGRTGTAVAVLRPAAVVTDDDLGQLARVLHTARVGVAAIGDPPVQYLHVEDLASAVVAVIQTRFDGVANVAPDGWIPPDALHDLEGLKPRLRVPSWAARAIAALRWRAGLAPVPPGIVPYTSHSWVVANDRIRALGWEANYTNEEAWVVSHDPGPLDRIPARRKQEIALVASIVLAVGAVVGLVAVLRRLRRVPERT